MEDSCALEDLVPWVPDVLALPVVIKEVRMVRRVAVTLVLELDHRVDRILEELQHRR